METIEIEKQRKQTLRMTLVTSMVTTFMGSALNLSVPAMETQFQTGAVLVGWVITAYTLAIAALSVPMGKIADVRGRRGVLLTGIGGFGILSVLCCFATSIWMLIGLRVLQGLAASMIFATNNAILISVFPGNQRGRVLGMSTAAVYVGLSAGPVLGGLMNDHLGWQSIFVFTARLSALSFFFAWKGAPKRKEVSEVKFDLAGNVLFIAMIATLLLGLSNLAEGWKGWSLLIGGFVLMGLFVLAENRAADPVIRISMFTRDRVFTFSNLAALLNYGATFAVSYLGSIYMQVVMGFSSGKAGLVLIAMPAVQAPVLPDDGTILGSDPGL